MVPRLMDIEYLMEYLSLGRNRARDFGLNAGAVIRYGSKVLYDREKIDKYIDRLEQE